MSFIFQDHTQPSPSRRVIQTIIEWSPGLLEYREFKPTYYYRLVLSGLAVASPLTSKLFSSQIVRLCATILRALGQEESNEDVNSVGVEVSAESPRKVGQRGPRC